ncbi:MAG: RNA methyltransferase [Anaerolineae bacterium]|nr:MAG: RNA methyltransferase [Anaerolineae bacterium]
MITSPHNPRLKLVRALQRRPRARRKERAFVIEGVRLVEEALASGWPFRFALYAANLNERGRSLVEAIRAAGWPVEETHPDLLRAVSDTATPQGVLAVLEEHPRPLPPHPTFLLIPDSVRDPGNLGTLLRTAAAARVDAVLIPPGTTDAFAPKVLRAGMGAHFRLPIHALTWEEIVSRCDAWGLRLMLAEMAGTPCWEADLRAPLALVIGGEAEGASAEARARAETTLGIPMPGDGESLNAAVAGAILIFEVVRQRLRGEP